jgi:hypothetical protein
VTIEEILSAYLSILTLKCNCSRKEKPAIFDLFVVHLTTFVSNSENIASNKRVISERWNGNEVKDRGRGLLYQHLLGETEGACQGSRPLGRNLNLRPDILCKTDI